MGANKEVIARVQQMEQYMDEVSEVLRSNPGKISCELRQKVAALTH